MPTARVRTACPSVRVLRLRAMTSALFRQPCPNSLPIGEGIETHSHPCSPPCRSSPNSLPIGEGIETFGTWFHGVAILMSEQPAHR